ncbi:hypothetical protein EV426DRAFT_703735 [Tirmania nivea]|nr:hypothetical protein EV426DRAFT_703735 [Tirmania nivea]
MPPKEDQLTSRAKTQLGWGDNNIEDYKKWRRHLKAYAVMNEITGRRGTSKAVWEGFKAFVLELKNRLPASGHTLLGMQRGDKEGNKAQEQFHHLLLDSLKKDRETETRDVGLKNVTIIEIVDAIKTRIPNGKYVRVIWGAVSKPPEDRGKPEDVEFITLDEDLINFLEVAKGMYKLTMLQVEVSKDGGPRDQTPRLDNRGYFPVDKFDLSDDTYDPVVSNLENELYLMKFGKHKGKVWPRSDHGWEHERAKIWKRIARLMKYKKELKRRHRAFKGQNKDKLIDSEYEGEWSWVQWLNPQDGKGYMRARATARAAGRYNHEYDDEKAAEAVAITIFGEPEVGNFNDFDST